MRILQVDEENVCVQFKMISGTKQNFIKLFTKYEEQELSFANDSIFDQINFFTSVFAVMIRIRCHKLMSF